MIRLNDLHIENYGKLEPIGFGRPTTPHPWSYLSTENRDTSPDDQTIHRFRKLSIVQAIRNWQITEKRITLSLKETR